VSDNYPIRFFPKANNFVKYMVSHPCAEPWSVLVETFVPCFIKFAATIYLFDINDMAIERLRQIDDYTSTPRRKRGKKWGRTQSVRDIMKGKRFITKAPFPYSRIGQGLTKTLLTVSAPLERIGFIWLVYAASDQFFYDWTTLLQQRNYCEAGFDTGPLQRAAATAAGLFNTSRPSLALPTLLQNRGGWATTSTGATLPANSYVCMFSLEAKTNFGSITNAYIWLEIHIAGILTDRYESARQTIEFSDWIGMIVNAEINTKLAFSASLSWGMGSDDAPVGACDVRNAKLSVFAVSGASR